MRIIFLAFVVLHFLDSAPLMSLKEIEKKPKGLARDFYIWEFISDKDTSLKDSIKAYSLVYKEIPKLKKALEAKGFHKSLPESVRCSKLTKEQLNNESERCVLFALKFAKVPSMSEDEVKFFKEKLQNNKSALNKINALRSKNIAQSMFDTLDAQEFAEVFNALSYETKKRLFDYQIKPFSVKKLAMQNKYAFSKIMQSIILDSNFLHFKRAILKIDVEGLDANTLFLIGINAVMLNNNTIALKYFERSRNAALNSFFKDRAIFWQYLLSKNDVYLHDLNASEYVSIFSIYANQKLKKEPNYKIITSFENLSKKPVEFNIKDPFVWQTLKDSMSKIKDSAQYENVLKDYYHTNSLPHLAFFHNRFTKYAMNYYIMPYTDLYKWKNNKEKALTLAVAKQESNFIPAVVSTSYALGAMQIMPFNVEPFAKKLGLKNIKLDSMFDPAFAYQFGTMYLNDLMKEFSHPLFAAYAYNGGPGFLRRTLAKKQFFIKNRNYEPWLSLELIPIEESRFYGMKVLANYIIYNELLGSELNLESLLKETLKY